MIRKLVKKKVVVRIEKASKPWEINQATSHLIELTRQFLDSKKDPQDRENTSSPQEQLCP